MPPLRKVYLPLLLVLFAAACATQQRTGPIPAPGGAPTEGDYRPEIPFERGPGERVATRVVFRTDTGRGYTVEVTDIAIGPGGAVSVPFDAPAMVEVRHGSGAGSAGGRTLELRMGSAFTVGEGETLTITAQEPITLRAYIYRAR